MGKSQQEGDGLLEGEAVHQTEKLSLSTEFPILNFKGRPAISMDMSELRIPDYKLMNELYMRKKRVKNIDTIFQWRVFNMRLFSI